MQDGDRSRVDRAVDMRWTQRFVSEAALHQYSARELKRQLAFFDICTDGVLEKADLVQLLVARRDTVCAICTDAFAEDGAFRLTACGHAFHDACIREVAMRAFATTNELPPCPTCRSTRALQPHAGESRPPPLTTAESHMNAFCMLFPGAQRCE